MYIDSSKLLRVRKNACKLLVRQNRKMTLTVAKEAAVRICSTKYVLLKISQYSQENTFVGVSF